MNDSGKARRNLQFLLFGLMLALQSGCVSTSARSSLGLPGGPPATPSAGVPGGTPSLPSGSTGGAPGIPSGTDSGDATAGTGNDPASSTGSGEAQKPETSGELDAAGKTDDEILAEALEEFNRQKGAPAGESEGSAEGNLPGTEPSTTGSEKVAALNDKLSGEFEEFDRKMLSERDLVRSKDNVEGNRGFDDRDSFETAEGGGSGEGEAAEETQTAMADRDLPARDSASLKAEGDTPANSTSNIPDDLVSGEGDDIIARQLREAAMKESDPKLREKLWEEYRKYKRDQK
ncbi:MAG: hypothetical protein HYY48_10565 [Gammaproteobacteria bacterium]|nr:hypothetical protein [Gammaproteobacteria bacterium]